MIFTQNVVREGDIIDTYIHIFYVTRICYSVTDLYPLNDRMGDHMQSVDAPHQTSALTVRDLLWRKSAHQIHSKHPFQRACLKYYLLNIVVS